MKYKDLTVAARHVEMGMERAIRHDPVRALAELLLNSDDSYKRLEDLGQDVSGRIEIDFERHFKDSKLTVRDFAEGMSPDDAVGKMADYGGDQSGLTSGASARGFFGRGAKDVFWTMGGTLETIRDGMFTKLIFVRDEEDNRLKVGYESEPATPRIRREIGLPKGNGTVASFIIPERTPQVGKLAAALQNFYMLRKLHSNPARNVELRNGEDSTPLTYREPKGQCEVHTTPTVKVGDVQLELEIRICVANSSLQSGPRDEREGGLLIVDEMESVLDLSLFGYNNNPDADRIYGEVLVKGLRNALKSNPNIITQERDGLNPENEIAAAIIAQIEAAIKPVVQREREKNAARTQRLSDATQRRVNSLVEELNKFASRYTKNTGQGPGSGEQTEKGKDESEQPPKEHVPDTLELYPKVVTLRPGEAYTVTAIINTDRCQGEAIVCSSENDLSITPETFIVPRGAGVVRQQIELACDSPGTAGTVELAVADCVTTLDFTVENISYPRPASGLELMPSERRLTVHKSQSLDLYVDLNVIAPYSSVVISVDDPDVARTSKPAVLVDPTEARDGIVHIPITVTGLQIDGKTHVRCVTGGYSTACLVDVQSRRNQIRPSSGLFAGLDWDEKDFPKCQYRDDDQKVVIHVNEPSFKYLNVNQETLEYDRAVQVAVAEAITREACARITQATPIGSAHRPGYLKESDTASRMRDDRQFMERLTTQVGPLVYRELVQPPEGQRGPGRPPRQRPAMPALDGQPEETPAIA